MMKRRKSMGKQYIGQFLWHDEEDVNCDLMFEAVWRLTVFGREFDIKAALCTALPDKGRPNTLYFVPKQIYGGKFSDPYPEVIGDYLEQYIWMNDKFVLIGASSAAVSEEDGTLILTEQ